MTGFRAYPNLPVLALLIALVAGCSLGSQSRPPGEERWVLVRNLMYRADGSEPEYVWVREHEIPTSVSTILFGKGSVIAPPHVVPRYAPPPGNRVISALQGGAYAAAQPRTAVDALPPPHRPGPTPAPAGVQPPAVAAVSPSAPPGLPPRGYVVYIDAGRLVIDLSAQHGLTLGDVVRVTREVVPIVHPVTGAYLGELDEDIATAQIVELREKFAIAEVREVRHGAQIQLKDRVVPRP